MRGDLDGLLVVSVEQAVAAPYASGRLADAGARVIKVERTDGDFARRYDRYVNGSSAYFVWLNRGKESVALDLKDAGDLTLLHRMIERSDIFIQNLAPGAAARLGIDNATLTARHPALISCSISGYGEKGPMARYKAYDLLVQAETGLAGINGTPEGPARVGVSVTDIAAGMTALQAILQALIGRSRTSKGRAIEVSLYHATADWMNVPYLQHRYGGHTPGRYGLAHPTIAPYGAYACSCGRAVLFSIQNEREWQNLCTQVLGSANVATDARFATNPDRVANRAALDGLIEQMFGAHDREAVSAMLEAAGIAFGRLSSLDDLAQHPQNRFMPIETATGPVDLLAPGALHDGAPLTPGPVPALDEHGLSIRAEFAD